MSRRKVRQVRPRRQPGMWLRWRCGEPDCPKRRWQFVTAVGEFDPVDAARADLDAHYARAHPELVDDEEVYAVELSAAA